MNPTTKLPALLAFLPLLVRGAHINKRATCTVTSNGDTSKSDAPALNMAITSCGAGGVIVLSAGKTYALNSVRDISACKSCEIQIEGACP
jgi:galacturan 1,4-alpha-galacturonidase